MVSVLVFRGPSSPPTSSLLAKTAWQGAGAPCLLHSCLHCQTSTGGNTLFLQQESSLTFTATGVLQLEWLLLLHYMRPKCHCCHAAQATTRAGKGFPARSKECNRVQQRHWYSWKSSHHSPHIIFPSGKKISDLVCSLHLNPLFGCKRPGRRGEHNLRASSLVLGKLSPLYNPLSVSPYI